MLLGANAIERYARTERMISPYLNYKVSEVYGEKVISYGQSGAGYDIRLAKVFRIKHQADPFIDPKRPSTYELEEAKPLTGLSSKVLLAPHEVVLGVSLERFRIPTNIMAVCVGKSTYARVHVIPHVTPLEPGWGTNSEHGNYLTLELANVSDYPVVVYLNEGILQVLFYEVDGESEYVGYYENQQEQRAYRGTEKVPSVSEPQQQSDGGYLPTQLVKDGLIDADTFRAIDAHNTLSLPEFW